MENAFDEAAAEASDYYDHWYNNWTEEDGTPVTAGDTQAQDLRDKKNDLADATYDREEAEAGDELAGKLKELGRERAQ